MFKKIVIANQRKIYFILFSFCFWSVTALLTLVAIFGHCGLAPDERCELDPPALSFMTDISPLTIICIAVAIYFFVFWIAIWQRKIR
jgi:hypothetical protein